MTPKQLSTMLAQTIPAKFPILITGAPGVGKSDIVAQAAKLAHAKLIISHPVVSDPTDAKGLPWVAADKKSATFLPFGEMQEALNAKELTAWFLDDLGQASPAVQASYMQLILARRINGHILPDNVVFVAATNRRTDRAGVSGILEPVKSRFTSIVELEVSVDDWCEWAIEYSKTAPAGHKISASVLAFIRFRRELLHKFDPSADLKNSPCPRTWHHASKILSLGLPLDIEHTALEGAIGEGAAAEFSAFLRMYRTMPNLDGILLDPDAAKIPTEPNVLWAVSTGLASKVNPNNFGRIARYAERMEQAGHGEFSVLILRDCMRRDMEICNTPEFVRLTSSDIGRLIMGN